MYYKEILSVVAILITFSAFFPYIAQIIRGHVTAHVFSWVIWGTTTCIVFLAQLQDSGGAGAWPIGVSGLITTGIAILAFVKTMLFPVATGLACLLLIGIILFRRRVVTSYTSISTASQ